MIAYIVCKTESSTTLWGVFALIKMLVIGLIVYVLTAAQVSIAQTESVELDDEVEQRLLKKTAVDDVVTSHDPTLILKGGELMVRQQVVKAAKQFVLRWGRARGLGKGWWEDRPEYQSALDDLLVVGDEILSDRFSSGLWLTNIWTEYVSNNFTGEQASFIAEHFKTEGGAIQARLIEWYLGETTLFYYTFTDRWDYRLEETRKELEELQKEALKRVPDDKVTWKAGEKEAYTFIACSPDSEYCPGVKYWKMLAIPMMGAVFAYMEDITREIKKAMEEKKDSLEPYFAAYERALQSGTR